MNGINETGRDRRTVMLRLRVTVAEKKALVEKSKDAGLTISDWIRNKSLGAKPIIQKPLPNKEILLRLLAALGKCGSNLNQVSRQLNRRQENSEFEVPIKYIEYLLAEFKTISCELREAISGNCKGSD